MAVQLRSQLPDLHLADMLPVIRKVIQEEYAQFNSVVDMVFNVGSMEQSIVNHTQVSSLAPVPEVDEGEEIAQDRLVQGFDKLYKALKYALLLPISREAMDDDMHKVISMNPKRLARAMASTREIVSMGVFNGAFSVNGPDGTTLCSTTHPALAPGVAAQTNRPGTDVDLDIANLKALLTIFRQQEDTAGNILRLRPKQLLVPASLEFQATQLVKSVMLPGGGNNDINSVNALYDLEVVVSDYITDQDAWFILGEEHNLHFFWREEPTLEEGYDFKSDVHLMKMTSRFDVGYSDWRGVVGTSGAD